MVDATPQQRALPKWNDLTAKVTRRAEVFVSGRYWIVEVCFLAILFSVLFTGGVDKILSDTQVKYHSGYLVKIEHPLADLGKQFPPASHDAKLNFRLTVPVILHWLPVPFRDWWFLPSLTVGAICSLLAVCCLFAYRVTGDRVCGLWITLGVASTYIGTFHTTRYYDAIALCQLLAAMLPGVPWSVRGLLVFTAAFTDERAFVAAPLLLFADAAGHPGNGWRRMTHPSSMAIIGGMVAYCLGRLLLAKYAGLSSSMGDVGLKTIASNALYWRSTVWFALGGGWLLVGLSMLSLWQDERRWELGMFACAIAGSIIVTLMVGDILRSATYVLPAMLVALTVLRRRETVARIRSWCLAAFVLSIAAGDFCVLPDPWPTQPLVVKWLCEAIHAVMAGFRISS